MSVLSCCAGATFGVEWRFGATRAGRRVIATHFCAAQIFAEGEDNVARVFSPEAIFFLVNFLRSRYHRRKKASFNNALLPSRLRACY